MRSKIINKQELQKLIIDELKNIPNGRKIIIPKRKLENLLFETIKDNNGNIVKLPVWTGDFLEKIDLSEVSFEDTSWSILSDSSKNHWQLYFDKKTCNFIKSIIQNLGGCTYTINYSMTNANIDFYKSWEYKRFNQIHISNCNFFNIDMSNIVATGTWYINMSNLGNTCLEVDSRNACFISQFSNLEGIDLSSYEIPAKIFFNDLSREISLNNILINTELHITGVNNNELSDDIKKIFINYIKTGKLIGCYINGKLVKDKYEQEELRNNSYDEFKEKIVEIEERKKEKIKKLLDVLCDETGIY